MVVTNKSDAIRIKLMYNKKVRDELKEHKMRYNLKIMNKNLYPPFEMGAEAKP